MPRLLLTRPVWQGQADPWAEALIAAGQSEGVEVLSTPMQSLSGISNAAQQILVRDLDDTDSAGDGRTIWLVATSPASAQALERASHLVQALLSRRARMRFAAVGEGSSEAFARQLQAVGLGEGLSAADILNPGPAGDAEKLAECLGEVAQAGDLALLLEGVQNKPDLAQWLTAKRLRVMRLPIYSRVPEKLPVLKKNDESLWVLVTTSAVVKPTITGLAQQNLEPAEAHWLGHHPAIGRALVATLPRASFTLLDSLSPKVILSRITLSP